MTADVQSAIVINRPVSEVSRHAADPDDAPLWYVNIKFGRMGDAASSGGGLRVAFVAPFLGRRLPSTYELVEFIPGIRMVTSSARRKARCPWRRRTGGNRTPTGPHE
jgi:hypothetical protein